MFNTVWNSEYKTPAIKYMLKHRTMADRRTAIRAIDEAVQACLGSSVTAGSDSTAPPLDKPTMADSAIALRALEVCNEITTPAARGGRVTERTGAIMSLIGGQKVRSYLDYGCGDASITQGVARALRLPKDDVYGVDILHVVAPGVTYVNHADDLMKMGEQIDLVTLLVTLHHLGPISLEMCMERVAHVLRPGGLLIIREHDFDGSATTRSFLNLIHLINDTANDQREDYEKIDYRSRDDWTRYLYTNGFYLVDVHTYTDYNPQRLYYASYRKK